MINNNKIDQSVHANEDNGKSRQTKYNKNVLSCDLR